LQDLRSAGFTVLALTPSSDALPLQGLEPRHRNRPALVMGAEGTGLSTAALAFADQRVVIPMARGVDSLNVAAAAAVAFWEVCR
jgi:tRNA G18 (ribose-2'-O)-methylase SpoU